MPPVPPGWPPEVEARHQELLAWMATLEGVPAGDVLTALLFTTGELLARMSVAMGPEETETMLADVHRTLTEQVVSLQRRR